ncbi:hypothetical protein KM043_001155 [Ampulex compressa]|nr:hypothetical protein KM043_001155 [Ampulex compressa]
MVHPAVIAAAIAIGAVAYIYYTYTGPDHVQKPVENQPYYPPNNNRNASTSSTPLPRKNKMSTNEPDCRICLSFMKNPYIALECSHVFHITCIKEWLKLQKTCPNCRAKTEFF